MQAELEALSKALEAPQRPVAAIVGGAKVSTKLDLLGNLVAKVDVLMIGGGMANTFLLALGKPVGKSLAERRPRRHRARDPGQGQGAAARSCCRSMPWSRRSSRPMRPRASSASTRSAPTDMILDIGPRSDRARRSRCWRASKTLVWNGPLGAFEMEPFDTGTVEVAEAAAELTQAGQLVSVAGGGDTVAALNAAGVADRFTYVSTAGGAFLEWMEGKPLPGVEVLRIK